MVQVIGTTHSSGRKHVITSYSIHYTKLYDTVKLNTYFKLFNYYLKTDTAKALQYETVIIQIASKYNIHKHIVNMNTAKAMYYKDIANFEMRNNFV